MISTWIFSFFGRFLHDIVSSGFEGIVWLLLSVRLLGILTQGDSEFCPGIFDEEPQLDALKGLPWWLLLDVLTAQFDDVWLFFYQSVYLAICLSVYHLPKYFYLFFYFKSPHTLQT